MNLEYERLNERLERGDGEHPWNGEKPPERLTLLAHALDRDPEIDELVRVVRRLQSSPHLLADPDFADLLGLCRSAREPCLAAPGVAAPEAPCPQMVFPAPVGSAPCLWNRTWPLFTHTFVRYQRAGGGSTGLES